MGFRALREVAEVFASKARSGPTPLRSNRLGVGPTYLHKRGHYNILPAGDFLRLAPGVGASGRAPRDRSCARRERGGRSRFRTDARGGLGG